jgi:hypothetical protein
MIHAARNGRSRRNAMNRFIVIGLACALGGVAAKTAMDGGITFYVR